MDWHTKQRYDGCLATPPLWKGTAVSPFPQIEMVPGTAHLDNPAAFGQQRLGKLAEAFIFHALKQESSMSCGRFAIAPFSSPTSWTGSSHPISKYIGSPTPRPRKP
jgi:hypothetical protein